MSEIDVDALAESIKEDTNAGRYPHDWLGNDDLASIADGIVSRGERIRELEARNSSLALQLSYTKDGQGLKDLGHDLHRLEGENAALRERLRLAEAVCVQIDHFNERYGGDCIPGVHEPLIAWREARKERGK